MLYNEWFFEYSHWIFVLQWGMPTFWWNQSYDLLCTGVHVSMRITRLPCAKFFIWFCWASNGWEYFSRDLLIDVFKIPSAPCISAPPLLEFTVTLGGMFPFEYLIDFDRIGWSFSFFRYSITKTVVDRRTIPRNFNLWCDDLKEHIHITS